MATIFLLNNIELFKSGRENEMQVTDKYELKQAQTFMVNTNNVFFQGDKKNCIWNEQL